MTAMNLPSQANPVRALCAPILLAAAFLCACGGGGGAPVDLSGPQLRVTDAAGAALPAEAARLVETSRGWEIYAEDSAASGFTLSYDAASLHVVQVVRGQAFSIDDLYLAVTSHPGEVAIGGFDLDGTQPAGALVARIVLQEGAETARAVSALPTGASSTPANFAFTDLGDGSVSFSWQHHNVGDYDQDGEVSIADITPVGVNFLKTSADPGWPQASIADGDDNGEINVADLTPIGQHYHTVVTGYKLEQAVSEGGPFSEVASLLVAAGALEPRRTFHHTLVPISGDWYRVRAYSAEDESQGAASAALQVNLLPPGQNPVPQLGADVTSGPVPLTVNFSAAGSTDPDGTIVKYEWDLDGDGSYETDATGTSGAVQHTYSSPGSFSVKLRVVDNDSRVGSAATVINAQPPPDGVPPTAKAYVMPNQGWLPLTVQLSPFGSADNEGVTSWKWDFDNDGTFETDATATQGYTSTTITGSGVKTISLQVGDAEGNTAEASVTVTVLNMAQSTVDYAGAFPQATVERIDIELTQGNWDAMWVDPQAELEVPADATILGDFLPSIGLSMKGNSSLNGPGQKKPWKLDINDNDPVQEYRNMKELVLNNGFKDPSMLRERMAYRLLYNSGVPSSFATHVELWIKIGGNAPEFWGVYTMVERVDKKFLENRYFDDSGNLYKCEMGADLTWKGSDIASYPVKDGEPCYAKRTNETAADWSDVINLIDVINSTPEAQFPAAIESVFNVDGFLRYHAAMLSCCNFDIYMYMSQNYYLYNNPLTGKFEWIPWDQNEAWGLFGQQAAVKDHPLYEKTDIGMGGGHDAPLWDKVMAVPEYRQDLAAYLDLLRRSWFDYDTVRPQAEDLHDLLRPHVALGDKMEFPISAFDSNWDTDYVPGGPGFPAFGIASFTQYRNSYVDAHLLADL